MTDKQKAVEEMAEIISDEFGGEILEVDVDDLASKLYAALYELGYRKQSETVKEFAEKAINSLNKYCYIPRQVPFDAGFIEGIKQAQATLMELVEQFGKEEKNAN